MRGTRTPLTLALVAVACSGDPARVFVPGTSFEESIRISTSQGVRATVAVEEPLVLHASRRSGPWVAAERDSLPPGACWLVQPPPDPEPEVADNLTWLIEPPGLATFELDFRPDHTREIRFSRPGVYRITARSHSWCDGPPYGGESLIVEVRTE